MVPPQSLLYVETSGGLDTTSTSSTGYSVVDIAIFRDGVFVGTGFRRIIAANTTGLTANMLVNWSFAVTMALAPGTHTIDVRARLQAGSAAEVSGGLNDASQGALNVLVIKG